MFWDRETQAHDVFPEIAAIVARRYRRVGEIGTSRVYVLVERLAELERLTGLDLSSLDSAELLALVPRLASVELGTSAGPAGAVTPES